MAGRKEDEKNEKIIRGLLKLPGNRKCINCNSMGPQYVCTTFSTFVCTTCSGIHREFTHRIKSISMAKFTSQEVNSLQAGGNELAKEMYLKELDMHRTPDSSNVDRLRDFIKRVYVDKRYTGEKSNDKPPRFKMGEKEEANESRRSDGYQSGSSRSPPYDDGYECRYSDRTSPGYDGRRSPGYDEDSQRHNGLGRSPARAGLVNDWRREDRFSNGRRSEDRLSSASDGECRIEGRSPDRQKDLSASSPSPVVRPVRDILGENVTPLRVGDPPKAGAVKVGDGPTRAQRSASFSSLASSNGNPTELRRENSLIDFFDAAPTIAPAAVAQTQQSAAIPQAAPSAAAPDDNNWACFDSPVEAKVSQVPSSTNSLESLFGGLSVPAQASAPATGVPGTASSPTTTASLQNNAPSPGFSFDSLFGSVEPVSTTPSNVSSATPISSASFFPPDDASASSSYTSFFPPGGNPAPSPVSASNASLFPPAGIPAPTPSPAPGIAPTPSVSAVQQQQSLFTNASSQKVIPSFGALSTSQGPVSNRVAQTYQDYAGHAQASHGVGGQPAGGRTELPADLFAAIYSPFMAPAYGWRPGLTPGMGMQMSYNNPVSVPNFQQQAKSTNPFDIGGEAPPAQFPSMAPLQAALPNMATPTGMAPPTAQPWMPPQSSSYAGLAPPMGTSFSSAVPHGVHMGQQLPSNMTPSRAQGYGGYGNDRSSFGSFNPNSDVSGNLNGSFPTPSLPRTASGNPFG